MSQFPSIPFNQTQPHRGTCLLWWLLFMSWDVTTTPRVFVRLRSSQTHTQIYSSQISKPLQFYLNLFFVCFFEPFWFLLVRWLKKKTIEAAEEELCSSTHVTSDSCFQTFKPSSIFPINIKSFSSCNTQARTSCNIFKSCEAPLDTACFLGPRYI